MMVTLRFLIMTAVVIMCMTGFALAQEPLPSASVTAQKEVEATHKRPHQVSHEGHVHHNHVSVFVGGTSRLENDRNSDLTLGADYERLLDSEGHWGVGAFGEAILADHTEWLAGGTVTYSPRHRIVFSVGLGAEWHQSHGETETEFLVRLGAGYTFSKGQWSFTPGGYFDFVREETSLVWGLYVGRGF